MKKAKPFVIVGVFWAALFLFVMAGYSGGLTSITGFAVSNLTSEGSNNLIEVQAIALVILFFTTLVTLFFLAREMANK